MNKQTNHPIILIPSYRPDQHLIQTVQSLINQSPYQLVIVDDGNSDQEAQAIFDQLGQMDPVSLVHHDHNKGKGAALKTGIAYIQNHFENTPGIVTADADGQHATHDILAVAQALIKNPDQLILGSRQFDQAHVPFKSALGNRVTSAIFRLVTGQSCPDTQTGLRGIPTTEYDAALKVQGDRFEYEMNYLLDAAKRKVIFKTVAIDTIYRDQNSHSHYQPLKDSLKILSIIIKFSLSSWLGALVDMALFFLLIHYVLGHGTNELMLATIIARIASGLVNYYLNVTYVFKTQSSPSLLMKYLSLFSILLALSAYGTALLPPILGSHFLKKILVDSFLFIASYAIQKDYIFNNQEVIT